MQDTELRRQLQKYLTVFGDAESQRATISAIHDSLKKNSEVLSGLTVAVSSSLEETRNLISKSDPSSVLREPGEPINEV